MCTYDKRSAQFSWAMLPRPTSSTSPTNASFRSLYTHATLDVPGITVSGGSLACLHVQCFPVQVRRHVL